MAFAQSPAELFSKAPPAVDEALRERATRFYQAHVDGKFRAADQLVAEDSKDVFFEMEKRRCNSFTIGRINYAENFTKAQVMIVCDTQMMLVPVGMRQVKVPMTSLWKIVDDQWMWYVPPNPKHDSPFGQMAPGPMPANGTGGGLPIDLLKGPDPASLRKMIEVDRQNLKFHLIETGEESIVVSSKLPGVMKLVVERPNFPGLEAKVEKDELKGGESTKLIVTYKPVPGRPKDGKHATEIRLRAEPIGRVIPIHCLISLD